MDEIPALHQKILDRATSPAMGKYVWFLMQPSMGYSFSSIHGTLYSYIAVQAAYLATYFPEVYWDCAYLRVTSGLDEDASTNYAKVAKAVGNMKAHGIDVVPIDINKSSYLFEPDEEHNAILFGMKGVNGTGGEVLNEIIANRPYSSFADFQERTSINKTTIIALIKGGAFDCFAPREKVMRQYLMQSCSLKKRVTMQNFNALIERDLLPRSLSRQKLVFRYDRALKKTQKKDGGYRICDKFYDFFSKYFDVDILEPDGSDFYIDSKSWKRLYDKEMSIAKKYVQDNQSSLLEALNSSLYEEQREKYASGSVSAWEMDSLGYYYHEHELACVNTKAYGIASYKDLPSEPVATRMYKRNGKEFPVFDTCTIMGTVIGKNNTKGQVDILTPDSGVVTVKLTLEHFAMYNRRISKNVRGVNKVMEQGWFQRGTLLMVNGYRRGDTFKAKSSRKPKRHQLYKIFNVYPNGDIMATHLRYGETDESI